MDKKEIRRLVRTEKEKLTTDEILHYSKAVSEIFLNSKHYKNATVLYPYLAYNQEILTTFIIEQAWKDRKTVCVPKVLADGIMEFYEIKSFDEVSPGTCGIPEPAGSAPPANFPEVLILMPGIAFDRTGNRIGYGGGFYDRYIARYEAAGTHFTKISLAYPFQIFPEIPTEKFDKKIDEIIYLSK